MRRTQDPTGYKHTAPPPLRRTQDPPGYKHTAAPLVENPRPLGVVIRRLHPVENPRPLGVVHRVYIQDCWRPTPSATRGCNNNNVVSGNNIYATLRFRFSLISIPFQGPLGAFLLFLFFQWYTSGPLTAVDVGHRRIHTRACAAHPTMPSFHPPHPIDQGLLLPALRRQGVSRGAQAAGLDRQTGAASGAYCLSQPPAGRPTLL